MAQQDISRQVNTLPITANTTLKDFTINQVVADCTGGEVGNLSLKRVVLEGRGFIALEFDGLFTGHGLVLLVIVTILARLVAQ